jgi:hypothetical protein
MDWVDSPRFVSSMASPLASTSKTTLDDSPSRTYTSDSPLFSLSSSSSTPSHTQHLAQEVEHPEESCAICLQPLHDATLLPACGHKSTCFTCILAWLATCNRFPREIKDSRRCPLCNTPVGEWVVHRLEHSREGEKYWLPPPIGVGEEDGGSILRRYGINAGTGSASSNARSSQSRRGRREPRWGPRRTHVHAQSGAMDPLEQAIENRRKIYREGLYAKVRRLPIRHNLILRSSRLYLPCQVKVLMSHAARSIE